MSAIAVSRSIGAVKVSVVIKEGLRHKLGITKLPIEDGSKITDHAYLEPKEVSLEFADSNAAATFASLVRLQESRVPFSLVTGLYVYRNMLIEELEAERDAVYSKILKGTARLAEIIIVGTAASATGGQPLLGGAAIPSKEIGSAGFADMLSGTVARGDNVTTTVGAATAAAVLGSFVR